MNNAYGYVFWIEIYTYYSYFNDINIFYMW